MASNCRSCGARMGGVFGNEISADNPEICYACGLKMPAAEAAAANERTEALKQKASQLPITTSFTISGREIDQEIDVITAECVFGMNIFRDLFAGVRDIVGGRSEATQKVLRDTRKTCLTELRKEAVESGADAIIGVNLDYSEFSGGGKSMLFLVASGTAVKLKQEEV
ncbi:MAG: YbjQ family protein [Halioglobus sp.]